MALVVCPGVRAGTFTALTFWTFYGRFFPTPGGGVFYFTVDGLGISPFFLISLTHWALLYAFARFCFYSLLTHDSPNPMLSYLCHAGEGLPVLRSIASPAARLRTPSLFGAIFQTSLDLALCTRPV